MCHFREFGTGRAQSRGAGVRGIKSVSRLRMRNVHCATARRSTRVGPAISSDVGPAELERQPKRSESNYPSDMPNRGWMCVTSHTTYIEFQRTQRTYKEPHIWSSVDQSFQQRCNTDSFDRYSSTRRPWNLLSSTRSTVSRG